MFADKTAWCYVDAEEIGALPMNWGVREKVAAAA
jgi:UDP-3-O-[3-hydroxymyristoyl] N-acetylglucosamine deacetylase